MWKFEKSLFVALIIFILFLYPQTRAVVVVVLIGILLLSVLL